MGHEGRQIFIYAVQGMRVGTDDMRQRKGEQREDGSTDLPSLSSLSAELLISSTLAAADRIALLLCVTNGLLATNASPRPRGTPVRRARVGTRVLIFGWIDQNTTLLASST